MNLFNFTTQAIAKYGASIIANSEYIDFLNNVRYFEEFPHHLDALTTMIKTGYFKIFWNNCVEANIEKLLGDGRRFIELHYFEQRTVSEILSSICKFPVQISRCDLLWHPTLAEDIDGLKNYILTLLQFYFYEGTRIIDIYCNVKNLNEFTIGFTFTNFTNIDIEEYHKMGDFITNDCVGLDISLRNGEYVSVNENDCYHPNVEFEWQHSDWAQGEWLDKNFTYTHIEPSLYIRIKIPICDIFEIKVSYPH